MDLALISLNDVTLSSSEPLPLVLNSNVLIYAVPFSHFSSIKPACRFFFFEHKYQIHPQRLAQPLFILVVYCNAIRKPCGGPTHSCFYSVLFEFPCNAIAQYGNPDFKLAAFKCSSIRLPSFCRLTPLRLFHLCKFFELLNEQNHETVFCFLGAAFTKFCAILLE